MQIKTTRFGDVEIEELKIIQFSGGLPGLEEYECYILLEPPETEPFLWLQSVEDPDIALAVVDPTIIISDYAPLIPVEEIENLRIDRDEDTLVLTVSVIPADFKKMTTNLMSPILININTYKGKQVILGGDYDLRRPIFDEISAYLAGGGSDAGADTQD